MVPYIDGDVNRKDTDLGGARKMVVNQLIMENIQ